jgi:RHS repeat-associated protein
VFVYFSGKLVAEYTTSGPPAEGHINYTTTDHLGSPRIITDDLGKVQSRRDFMPFGEDLNAGVGNRTADPGKYSASTDKVRQKFTGYQKDNETELDFAEARMCKNRHGRFTAVDPLLASGKSANPQSFNRYVYVGNNPLLLADRDGLIWGRSDDGRVRWFGKKLGAGFSEFRPDDWEYIGANNKIIRLDPNSRKWTARDVPLSPTTAENPIPSFLGGFRQTVFDSGTGAAKGFGNFGIGVANLVTDGVTGGISRSMLGYDNPFEIERYQFHSAAEARFGIGTEIGAMAASIAVTGAFTGNTVSLSLNPESSGVAGLLTQGRHLPNAGGQLGHFLRQLTNLFAACLRMPKGPKAVSLAAIPPRNSAFAQEALALPPINDASMIQRVFVPAGTRLQRSRALPQFGRRGGGEQFQLLDELPRSSFGPRTNFFRQ